MREFWVASGHHLTRRADHGGLVATPELIMAYLARLPRRKEGERRSIDLNGDLLVKPPGGGGPPDRSSLVDALAQAAWYDPRERGPKFG